MLPLTQTNKNPTNTRELQNSSTLNIMAPIFTTTKMLYGVVCKGVFSIGYHIRYNSSDTKNGISLVSVGLIQKIKSLVSVVYVNRHEKSILKKKA
jgi:hypothetical protein